MAKGQHLSRYQQGIVRRYYEHLDTTVLARLHETVSDLFVTSDDKVRERLWKKVGTTLGKTAANEPRVAKVLADRDLNGLASLVSELAGAAGRKNVTRRPAPRTESDPGLE